MALLIVSVAVTYPTWGGPCGLSPDSITYLQGARALLEGEVIPPHATILPPLLQLLLASISLFDAEPLRLFPIFNCLCMGIAAILTWRLARRHLAPVRMTANPQPGAADPHGHSERIVSDIAAWLIAAVVATSPVWFEQILFLRSEPLFLVLLLASLLLADRLAAAADR
ncbi:MAG: hypothetical protein V3T70_03620, partial [Phycisphaerae bacterium]